MNDRDIEIVSAAIREVSAHHMSMDILNEHEVDDLATAVVEALREAGRLRS